MLSEFDEHMLRWLITLRDMGDGWKMTCPPAPGPKGGSNIFFGHKDIKHNRRLCVCVDAYRDKSRNKLCLHCSVSVNGTTLARPDELDMVARELFGGTAWYPGLGAGIKNYVTHMKFFSPPLSPLRGKDLIATI